MWIRLHVVLVAAAEATALATAKTLVSSGAVGEARTTRQNGKRQHHTVAARNLLKICITRKCAPNSISLPAVDLETDLSR
jgi:hypothetical protein